MIRGISKIVLAGALVLPVCLCGAQQSNHPGVTSGLRERIGLGRSVMEFAEDFSLFDDQLYGVVDKQNDQRELIDELDHQINTTSDRLAMVSGALPDGTDSPEGSYPLGADQQIRAEVDLLESQLAAMRSRVNELMVRGLLAGENVVLDVARWEEPMSSGAVVEILEAAGKSSESARAAPGAARAASDAAAK